MKSPKFDPETVVADRFCLKRPLSSGAMGTVWLAHHTRLDVPCAVKFIDSGSGTMEELGRRFEREAKAAALLRCANVVTILDFGVFEDRAYLAMEYLEGETLEKRLARRGQLSPAETVAILAQVGRALAKAHAAGLVHRDLKPANIFLVTDDDREIVKVLDFGIVKMPADENKTTQVGALLGTPNYMSPEQARGLSGVDHRSDLWSLAVLAYECVTGELPFEAAGIGELIGKIVLGPIPLPSSVALVPPAFDHWWARAAAREPADRFGGALEQVKALAAAFELPKDSLLPRKRSAAPEALVPSIRPRSELATVPARPMVAESERDQSAPGVLVDVALPPLSAPKSRAWFVVSAIAIAAVLAFVVGITLARGRAIATASAASPSPSAAPLAAPPESPSGSAALIASAAPSASAVAEAPPADAKSTPDDAPPAGTAPSGAVPVFVKQGRRPIRTPSKASKKVQTAPLTAKVAPAKPAQASWTPLGLR